MPTKYEPAADDMDASMYGSSTPETPAGEESGAPSKESVDEENAEASEILVAKKELPPGTKEGDTCAFRVTKDYGDEFSLQYVKEGEGKETETEKPTSAADDFEAMDQEKV